MGPIVTARAERMARNTSPLLLLASLLLLAGCGKTEPPPLLGKVSGAPQSLDRYYDAKLRPEAPPPPELIWDVGDSKPIPFPPARVTGARAAQLLADDPIAQRFLVLRELADDRVIVPEAAKVRIEPNKGGLLPLTADEAPAIGLDRPLPPLEVLIARARALAEGKSPGTPASRGAEGNALLDSILPSRPAGRMKLAPPDLVSARKLLPRLDRLEDTGLISPDEHQREKRAVEALIDGGTLPEIYAPPAPPPPPPPPKPKGKAKPHRGFKPEFVPDPPGTEAPKLGAGAKEAAGLHLLSMAAGQYGEQAWTTLVKQYPELAALGYKVVKADLGELGTTYRLVAGPVDAATAEKMCGLLRTKGQSCMPTPFPQ